MKYDTFLAFSFDLKLKGSQIISLFSSMVKNESRLDEEHINILELLRAILYEHLSIEEVEQILRDQTESV